MEIQKNKNNLIHREKCFAFENAPRCNAKTKNGKPCLCPAIKGKLRCRLHGGAIGSGAPLGNTNAFKHGNTTKDVKILKKNIQQAIQSSRKLCTLIDSMN